MRSQSSTSNTNVIAPISWGGRGVTKNSVLDSILACFLLKHFARVNMMDFCAQNMSIWRRDPKFHQLPVGDLSKIFTKSKNIFGEYMLESKVSKKLLGKGGIPRGIPTCQLRTATLVDVQRGLRNVMTGNTMTPNELTYEAVMELSGLPNLMTSPKFDTFSMPFVGTGRRGTSAQKILTWESPYLLKFGTKLGLVQLAETPKNHFFNHSIKSMFGGILIESPDYSLTGTREMDFREIADKSQISVILSFYHGKDSFSVDSEGQRINNVKSAKIHDIPAYEECGFTGFSLPPGDKPDSQFHGIRNTEITSANRTLECLSADEWSPMYGLEDLLRE